MRHTALVLGLVYQCAFQHPSLSHPIKKPQSSFLLSSSRDHKAQQPWSLQLRPQPSSAPPHPATHRSPAPASETPQLPNHQHTQTSTNKGRKWRGTWKYRDGSAKSSNFQKKKGSGGLGGGQQGGRIQIQQVEVLRQRI